MTTADTATARPSAWQRFRAWRRGRPFWGGLVAIVAGLEIYLASQTSLGEMEIKIGPGGMAAYVIPLMLIVAGLLAWFTPAQRHFYGIVVPAVSIYALLEINLGGWLIGTILGMVGGALIFAWTENKPDPAAAVADEPEPDGGEDAEDTDHTPRHAAFDELFGQPDRTAIPRQGGPDDDREVAPVREQGGTNGRMLAVITIPLLLVAAGLVAIRAPEAAYAAPCTTQSTGAAARPNKPTTNKTTPASPKAAGVAPSASPSAEPSPSESPKTGLLSKIVGGIVNLIDPSPSAAPEESPTPTASPEAPAPQPTATGTVKPSRKPVPGTTQKPSPCTPASESASPSPVPTAKQLRADVGQPDVAAKASRMTGTRVTMDTLTFVGVVDLPTADGPIKVLKFTMKSSTTTDFQLLTYARGVHTRDVVFQTKSLTVSDGVAFYTSRFQGKLLGLFDVDYTPENPPIIPPPGIPLPIEIFFTDPDIQLVWVDAGKLTGTPSLTSTLA